MLIALHRGKGLIARAIQWQTRSVYSHASMIFLDRPAYGAAIEAKELSCVRHVPPAESTEPDHDIDLFRVDVTSEQYMAIYYFALAQIGKHYDYLMVARFISRRQESRRSSGKWFCSELVFAAFQKAGINLLDRIEPWAVSPGLLALSPLLKYEKTIPAVRPLSGDFTEPFDRLPGDGIHHGHGHV